MNLEENHNSLKTLKSGISKIELLSNLDKVFLGGEIKLTNKQLAEIAFLNEENKCLPRSLLLSLIAAKQAWGDSKPSKSIRTAIIGSTTIGGMDLTEDYFKTKGYSFFRKPSM